MKEELLKRATDLMHELSEQKIPALFIADIGNECIKARNVGDVGTAGLLCNFLNDDEGLQDAFTEELEKRIGDEDEA